MKKLVFLFLLGFVVCALLQGCGKAEEIADTSRAKEALDAPSSESKITEEMAYEGVSNYCHGAYDWSMAEDNPDMMYLEMGEETKAEYQVIFRSYTGAFVYFYVDKSSGTTRITE